MPHASEPTDLFAQLRALFSEWRESLTEPPADDDLRGAWAGMAALAADEVLDGER